MAGKDVEQMNVAPSTMAVLKSEGNYSDVFPRLLSLAGAEGIIQAGESVLLKPNLHTPQHWRTAGTTNPALIVALIEWAHALWESCC